MKFFRLFSLLILPILLLGCSSIKKLDFDAVGLSEPVSDASLIVINDSINPNLYFTQGIKSKTILIPVGTDTIPVYYSKIVDITHGYNEITTKYIGYSGFMRGVELNGVSEYELNYEIKDNEIRFWLLNKSTNEIVKPKSIDRNKFTIKNDAF